MTSIQKNSSNTRVTLWRLAGQKKNAAWYILCTMMLLLVDTEAFAQRVRWPYEVKGANGTAGITWMFRYGFFNSGIAPTNEADPKKKPRPSKNNAPAELRFKYSPFEARQLCVVENYNPGAITKIAIGYRKEAKAPLEYHTVYEGEAKAKPAEYTLNHYFFEPLPNITEVVIHMDYMAVDGVNQLAGVILCDFETPFVPKINLPEKEVFTKEVLDMNADVSGRKNPASLQTSADGRTVYFTNSPSNSHDQLYEGIIGKDGKFSKVHISRFNLPHKVSTASGLAVVSQDNNTAYVSSMDVNKFNLYKVYKNEKGKWNYDKEKIPGYNSDPKDGQLNFVMSYDEQTIILSYKDKTLGKTFGHDMYVSTRKPNGQWSPLQRISDDLNTIYNDIPSYIAPDNKTLFFASAGHYGYGGYDLFMTKRLDDTWLHWSYPVNLGPLVNSKMHDRYITFDVYNHYTYVTRSYSNNNVRASDIYRINMLKPEPTAPAETVAKQETTAITVEPTILIEGKVTNKKNGKPVPAKIHYHNIKTKELLGIASANTETGEYAIVLTKGINFSFEAVADQYLSEGYNLNLSDLASSTRNTKNFELAPLVRGESIRLNNIFFETAKHDLKEESFLELDKLVSLLKNNSKLKIEIQGHTDNVGSDDFNLKLSNDRAKSVVDYLITQSIAPERLVAKGYGNTMPVGDNATEEGRAYNRRVEMKIL